MATEATKQKTGADRGRRLYRFTAQQVLKILAHGIIPDGDRIELWDGMIYRMTKGPGHNYVVNVTAAALRAVIPIGFHVTEEKSGRFGQHSLPEPDVAVVRGSFQDYKHRQPELAVLPLVVEVCEHTARADHGPKLRRYAGVGIPVYWIINVLDRTVEVFTQPSGARGAARYDEKTVARDGETFPVVVDGREIGRFSVADLLP
jgi:Uma2 family endonuclease